jgi:hypothetical protein
VLHYYAALLIWGLSLIQAGMFLLTGYYGMRLRRQRERYGGKHLSDPFPFTINLNKHKRLVRKSLIIMGITVLIIEATIRNFKLSYPPFFWWVHCPILVLMLIFLALALVFNGKRDYSKHDLFAPLAVLFVIASVITGDILVYQLIWLHG